MMRRRGFPSIVVVALVAVPSAAAAQPQQPRIDGASECRATLDGHVVDDVTHEPVVGALVSVDGEVVAVTDEAGHFDLTGPCRAAIVVEVARDDYAPSRRVVSPGTPSVELPLHATTGEVIAIKGEAVEAIDMRSTAKLSGESLERTRGRALAEALADVPGVSQLGSGSGAAKPIVRGQFGRRLLLLVDSVRHRAQEWGIDHAPEIDPFAADEITVVRGASGVRYGPDAIGGAVLVDPPPLLRKPGVAGQVHLIGLTNGLGGVLAARVQGASERLPGLAGQIDTSLKRLAASVTPDYPLDNTGVREWNLGTSAGYRTGDDEYRLSYSHYQATLGVCSCLRLESRDDFLAQLERGTPANADLYEADLEIERPYQAVAHDLTIGRARWGIAGVGTIALKYSFQHDHRREYDVVRDPTIGPQFDFRLLTHDLDVALEHRPIHLNDHLHLEGSAGVVGMEQDHRYSGLPLVPDHAARGAGGYAIERLIGHDFELELGLRYDVLHREASLERDDFDRLVRSDQLPEGACGAGEETDPVACSSTFHTVSASVGGLYQLSNPWSLKLDLSTASRPPNTDEQYLNGTSPTFPVLGLGKPDLGPETTYSSSLTTTYQGEHVAGEASIYANLIDDYIYFAPALDDGGDPIFDVLIRGSFPRFVTRPVDAVFYGGDAGFTVAPLPFLELGGQASMVRARDLTNHAYLVFVPADKLRGSVTLRRPADAELGLTFVTVSGAYVARQTRFDPNADLAPPPDGYFLLGAEAGTSVRLGDQTIKLAVQGTNLLNARYRDYTSLLRYFADQPGWQALARLTVEFAAPR
jgi:iron complex outermembrane receptor protein